MNSAITIKNFSLNLGDRTIFTDVDLEIPEAKLTYLIGANGSGKTSLIRAILGLITDYKGNIQILGKENSQEVVSRQISYVPQYAQIDRAFPITVREMLELDCSLHNKSCHKDIVDHLQMLGAQKLIDRRISGLSGGEFQKVLLARAITNEEAKIVIMDEPFNNLDHQTQHDLMDIIYRINREHGKTLIIISHDYHIIDNDNDNVIFALEGKILTGQAREVLNHQHVNF